MNEGLRKADQRVVLAAEDLRKEFRSADKRIEVLRGVQLRVRRGEMVGVVGASGVGKTTLLQILGALDRPTGGRVLYGEQDVFSLDSAALARFRNRRIGFVFQFHHLLAEFTALENTMMPALIQGVPRGEARRRARALLSEVGLAERLHHKPGELSGGEQQRVAVARALLNEPDVILADEPTGNVDERTGEEIHDLLQHVNRTKGASFLIATHNPRLAGRMDRVVRISDGRIEAVGMTPDGQFEEQEAT
ncbi:MAG: ABC transporter ATP-binding protein [Nitrospinota bacterium]